MKSLILSVALLSSLNAFADGFVCKTESSDLKVQVYNNTEASEGTRNAATMVLSDPRVQAGRKTIAVLRAPKTLSNEGATYTGRVDLRFSESNREGEDVLGTKLGFIKTIVLDVDFSYGAPVEAGDELEGVITLNKRNGEIEKAFVTCERYLKN